MCVRACRHVYTLFWFHQILREVSGRKKVGELLCPPLQGSSGENYYVLLAALANAFCFRLSQVSFGASKTSQSSFLYFKKGFVASRSLVHLPVLPPASTLSSLIISHRQRGGLCVAHSWTAGALGTSLNLL